MKLSLLTHLLLLSNYLLAFLIISRNGNQIDNLNKFIKSRKSANPPRTDLWDVFNVAEDQFSPVYVGLQHGLKEADKIGSLPGQPQGANFDQYAGYIPVDQKAGRALFYYFVESPQDSSTKPLVLWLNGGSNHLQAIKKQVREKLNSQHAHLLDMEPWKNLDPSESNSDRMTLFRNDYAWNNVANVIFLESPAVVGFSYSNTTSDYENEGDKRTAEDSYKFLINCGDTDGRVPVTSRYAINTLKLPLQTPWRPWYSNGQVGGYVAWVQRVDVYHHKRSRSYGSQLSTAAITYLHLIFSSGEASTFLLIESCQLPNPT